jgi:hypothetical protein
MTSAGLEPAYDVVLVLEPRPTFAVEEIRDRLNLAVFSIAALIATAHWLWFLLKIADILLGH